MKVIYTGAFRFPDKDAASQRVLGIGKALRQNGAEVVFCGWEKASLSKYFSFVYEGFQCFSMGELDNKIVNKLSKIRAYFKLGNNTLLFIKKYILMTEVTHIIVYNGTSLFLYRLLKYCKKNHIKLVVDCTEYYSVSQLSGGLLGPPYLDMLIRLKIMNRLVGNIIVISQLFLEMYRTFACRVTLIPPLVDFSDDKWYSKPIIIKNNKRRRLIYAGTLGKKDVILPLIRALNLINKDRVLIELILVGVSCTEELLINSIIDSKLETFVINIGRIEMRDVSKYYKSSDFSILLRPDKKYANYGFPTKLVESLANGIPIIVNETSDIGKYITSGVNGFLLTDISIESIIKVLEQVINTADSQILQMKCNAFESAKNYFDYNNYADSLHKFFEEI